MPPKTARQTKSGTRQPEHVDVSVASAFSITANAGAAQPERALTPIPKDVHLPVLMVKYSLVGDVYASLGLGLHWQGAVHGVRLSMLPL